MNWSWLSFTVGLLVGWLIEWLIDFVFWRRRRQALGEANAELQAQLDRAGAEQRALEEQLAGCRATLQAREDELTAATAQLANAEARATSLQHELAAREKVAADCEEALQAREGELTTATAQLEEAQTAVGDLQDRLATQERLAADCAQTLQAREGELAALSERLSSVQAALEACLAERADAESRAQALATQLTGTRAAAPIVVEPDELNRIEGIGPKIAEVLQSAGVLTYAQLADTPVSRLREILQGAGRRFRMADPTSWPEQARLAAEEKWDELGELQGRLSGGRASRGPELAQ